MSIFEPVVLTWKGKDYEVKPNNILPMIAKIEDQITLNELQAAAEGNPSFSKISMAYGSALRHAGARVQNEEVYQALFDDGGMGAIDAINNLLLMMVPPDLIKANADSEGDTEKKPEPAPNLKD